MRLFSRLSAPSITDSSFRFMNFMPMTALDSTAFPAEVGGETNDDDEDDDDEDDDAGVDGVIVGVLECLPLLVLGGAACPGFQYDIFNPSIYCQKYYR
jgi:hypothetical protein